jgi:APA family basic amino acid/polyamine antiporter
MQNKKLSLLDATMIVSGSMIGSGIFIVSSSMIQHIYSPFWLLLIWAITALVTISAALSYGELSGMFPKAGGQYTYLKEAYNSLTAFLYGWSFFAVIQTGTIAAVAVAFSKFTGYFIPIFDVTDNNKLMDLNVLNIFTLTIYPAQLLAILTIVLLTYINTKGVKHGKVIQNVFTGTKIISLLGLLIVGLVLGFSFDIWSQNWQAPFDVYSASPSTSNFGIELTPIDLSGFLGLLSLSFVGSIFSSDAWNNVTFIAGEIDNPQKNIGKALILGTGLVSLLYFLTNVMYLGTLTLDQIAFAPQERVGVVAANTIFGEIGTLIMAAMIMVSTFGCNNGLILSGSRVYQTMANDGLFLKGAAKTNKHGAPAWALWMQCIWASVLCLSGKYNDLLNYVVFVVMLFYILTIGGVFILRIKKPEMERTYLTPYYPYLPLGYLLFAAAFCILLAITTPGYTLAGLFIILTGIPLYYIARK